MTDQELETLLSDLESDRVERKESFSDGDRIRQAICAFSNDLPGHNKPGVLFIGVNDKGAPIGLNVTDELLLKGSNFRSEGRILPVPTLTVEHRKVREKQIIVITVQPSFAPPVRFDGRVWVRVGPSRAVASPDDERRLTEKRLAMDLSFDETPVRGAQLADLNLSYFRDDFLKQAFSAEVLAENGRSVEHQLAALRFVGPDYYTATSAGLLVLGYEPKRWIKGAYIQYVRFDGLDRTSPIRAQRRFEGSLRSQLQHFRDFLPLGIEVSRWPVEDPYEHVDVPDYPEAVIREAVYNAVMHRNYQTSNAPVSVYWFNDRVEVDNPGGVFGRVTAQNFSYTFDCRNPVIADSMRTMQFVERFGLGITRIKTALEENGNPPAEFHFEPESTRVIIRARPKPWNVVSGKAKLEADFKTTKGI